MPERKVRRVPYRVQLDPAVKCVLEEFCDRLGTKQITMTTRIIEWFADQPEEVQAAVLGLYPQAIAAEIARMLLDRRLRNSRTTEHGESSPKR